MLENNQMFYTATLNKKLCTHQQTLHDNLSKQKQNPTLVGTKTSYSAILFNYFILHGRFFIRPLSTFLLLYLEKVSAENLKRLPRTTDGPAIIV